MVSQQAARARASIGGGMHGFKVVPAAAAAVVEEGG
jgi:hypothetical protein